MFLWAAVGFLVGWLVNLIADTLPLGLPLSLPHCLNCDKPRRKTQWSGILTYALGQSRCAYCSKRISFRWPLVELVSLFLFAYLYALFDFSLKLFIISFYSATLLLVCVIDFEQRLILNRITWPAIIAALALSFVTPNLTPLSAVAGGLTGFILAGIIYLGGLLFVRLQARRGHVIREVAFGQGDVTLMLFIGLITGLSGILRALTIGVLLGGLAAVVMILIGVRRRQSTLFIPFAYGPYLAIAGWYVLIQNAVANS